MAASTPASELSDGPVLSVINKRLRALRKKYNRIIQMEESGKTLNKEQEETLRSKSAIIAGMDELEKLRVPLAVAVTEEINQATQPRQEKGEGEDSTAAVVEDLVKLLYFGSMFDVKSLQQSELVTATILTRTMERACCLSYDCMPPGDDDENVMDLLLRERDLDLISLLSGLVVSRPVDSPLSHKHALRECVERAKLWLAKSDRPIEPNSDATYAGLRSKLDKIIGSLYFTTDPVKVEAAAGQYGSYPVPEHGEGEPVDVPLQLESPSVQCEQKEEPVISQAIETHEIHASNVKLQQAEQGANMSELPAEPKEVVPEAAGVDNLKDADFNEQQSVPQGSDLNYRGNRGGNGGGRRGHSNGHGGRGRGGSHQNGRNQYYDQPGNYRQRNYSSYRGKGGRGTGGGGSYNHYASDDQVGNFSAGV